MHLEKLILHNFKNHEYSDFDFHEKINLIVGQNGAGKTNILDAIYFLAWTQSKSNLTDTQLKRDGLYDFIVDAKFAIDEQTTTYRFRHNQGVKELSCNKEPIKKRMDHIGQIPLISIFPNDVNLIYQDSSLRRSFLDQFISQLDADYLKNISRLKKIVSQKTALLKSSQTKDTHFFQLLDLYNRDMDQIAKRIVPIRKDIIQQIDQFLSPEYARIADNANELTSISYKERYPTDNLYQLLTKNQQQEIQAKKTIYGPHKDDIEFSLNNLLLKKYGSQGQVKTFLISLKLAMQQLYEDESGKSPILLLDDLFDKLDHTRVEHLLQLILEENLGQLFITTTSDDYLVQLFEKWNVDYQKFVISNGQNVQTASV